VRARTLLLLTGLSPWLGAVPAAAQPGPATRPADRPAPERKAPADKPPDTPPDKPARDKAPDKPVTLDARVKALEADLEDARDATADLKSEVADLKTQLAASKPPVSLNALNPQITAFLNGAMRVDDKQVLTPGGVAIDDRPFLRTAEFDFRAAVFLGRAGFDARLIPRGGLAARLANFDFCLPAIRPSLVSVTASRAATGTSPAIGRGDGRTEVAMGWRSQRHHTRSS